MSQNNPPPEKEGFLSSITTLAKELPPVLRFGVTSLLILVFILGLRQTIPPDLLPLIYGIVGLSFLGYLWWEWQQFQERKHQREVELAREEQAQRFEIEKIKHQPPLQPEPPQPPLPPAELRQRYLNRMWQKCATLSMTSIDPQAKKAEHADLELHRVFTSLDIAAPAPDSPLSHTPSLKNDLGTPSFPRKRESTDIAAPAPDSPLSHTPSLKNDLGTPSFPRKRESTSETDAKPEKWRQPALTFFSQHPHLVLLGDPGSGKTTLVKFLALCLVGEALQNTTINRSRLQAMGWKLMDLLPTLIILRDYAAGGLSQNLTIAGFVTQELKTMSEELAPFAPQLLAHWKEEGGILLLDGLDEVPEAHKLRESLKTQILAVAADYPKLRIVVTSRPYAYDDPNWQLPHFARADLQPFTLDQMKNYIAAWYTVTSEKDPDLHPDRANQYANQLQWQVEHNPNLSELGQRPLLLALMVSLHRWRGGGALPQKREELYDESVNLLLDLWQRPKQLYDSQNTPTRKETTALEELGIGLKELRDALSEVAFEAHRDQAERTRTADIEEGVLAGKLFASSKKKELSINQVIQYVKDRAGLLEDRGPNPQGKHIYAFAHRTFQEYLAACHLLRHDSFPDNLVALVRQDLDRWREATLLAANRVESKAKSTVWALVEGLCAQAAPTAGQNVSEADWWGAFLAGQVLVETELFKGEVSPRNQNKQQLVQDWLAMLLGNSPLTPRDRALAGRALAQLGDPRRQLVPQTVEDLSLMPFCWVPQGAFWLGSEKGETDERPMKQLELPYSYWLAQYPVTVTQFRLFVQATKHQLYDKDALVGDANAPVQWVTWHEALKFCQWLHQKWGDRLPKGYQLTLPSEVEWEKAARGGLTYPATPYIQPLGEGLGFPTNIPKKTHDQPQQAYPWGEVFDLNRANTAETGIAAPSAVGLFPLGQSVYGCQEMSGNVWEWTRSHYVSYPYQLDGQRERLDAGNDVWRVLRGGSYANDQTWGRVAARHNNPPHYRSWGPPVFVWRCPLSTSDLCISGL